MQHDAALCSMQQSPRLCWGRMSLDAVPNFTLVPNSETLGVKKSCFVDFLGHVSAHVGHPNRETFKFGMVPPTHSWVKLAPQGVGIMDRMSANRHRLLPSNLRRCGLEVFEECVLPWHTVFSQVGGLGHFLFLHIFTYIGNNHPN